MDKIGKKKVKVCLLSDDIFLYIRDTKHLNRKLPEEVTIITMKKHIINKQKSVVKKEAQSERNWKTYHSKQPQKLKNLIINLPEKLLQWKH